MRLSTFLAAGVATLALLSGFAAEAAPMAVIGGVSPSEDRRVQPRAAAARQGGGWKPWSRSSTIRPRQASTSG